MGLYFMLIAGGGTGNSRDEDGAFTFDTSELTHQRRAGSTGSALFLFSISFLYYINRNKED